MTVDGIPTAVGETDGATWPSGGLYEFALRLEWNGDVLRLGYANFDMLIAADPESHVWIEEETLENDGKWEVVVLDLNDDGLESGGGVLGRLTFQGVSSGEAVIRLSDVLIQDAWNPYGLIGPSDVRIEVGGACP